MTAIEAREQCIPQWHAEYGACYNCCDTCNYDRHRCHFCGQDLAHDSTYGERHYSYYYMEWRVRRVRHWLSDCRPDLIDGSYDGTKMTDGPMA